MDLEKKQIEKAIRPLIGILFPQTFKAGVKRKKEMAF